MSWSTIEVGEMMQQFTPGEQAMLQRIQIGDTNPAGLLALAVRAARGCIAAGGNPLGPEDTIPDQVRNDVIVIARWQWLTSFPALKAFQTEYRKFAAEAAQKRLDAIADGHPKVERPPNGDATAVPLQRPNFPVRGVTAPARNYTDTTQDG